MLLDPFEEIQSSQGSAKSHDLAAYLSPPLGKCYINLLYTILIKYNF